ncbi:MAG: iron-sulfur cluster assembly accessory protein [Cyanobacteria bacterium J06631_2]
MVDISPAAVAEIKRIKLSRELPDIYLRLMVKSGGCLDFFYDLKFETIANVDDVPEESGDRLFEIAGVNVAINNQSWKYVESLQLDYVEDLMGGGFRFHNPQNKKTCGCGISFCV